MYLFRLVIRLFALFLLLLSFSCAGVRSVDMVAERSAQYVTAQQDETLLGQFVPVFVLEDSYRPYNRIGTPTLRVDGRGRPQAYVDPRLATIYSMEQRFERQQREYTNLIYRIHFERTPFPHLTGGRNVGLIVIVTLDQNNKPLLLTTVHTCGCYLALIPTSYLSPAAYPTNWSQGRQYIYGQSLPGFLDLEQFNAQSDRIVYRIKGGTHRVMDVVLRPGQQVLTEEAFSLAQLQPMALLRKLPFGESEVSFFETDGPRKGYVRNSHKPFERLLMSWWALDWRIGEDKDLGPKEQTGTTFYTSLKIWARDASDLWEFSDFLNYWGWGL